MREYDVITDTDLKQFKKKVNQRLQDGWILEGGVSVSVIPNEPQMEGQILHAHTQVYAQAMRQ